MSDGWTESAEAWIARLGEEGDWGRRHVLDPAMLGRLEGRRFRRALDVGCGEGRFCRLLQARGIATLGLDPTPRLLAEAKERDPAGHYIRACAEELPLAAARFDLVVSYLTLLDIPGYRAAIAEMARVLAPGGTLLVANLTSFVTSGATQGWVKDEAGRRLHFPVDRYLEEFPYWDAWAGIRIKSWHRPLGAYMRALLGAGLELRFFDEPEPLGEADDQLIKYRRVPWFFVMEWQRPAEGVRP